MRPQYPGARQIYPVKLILSCGNRCQWPLVKRRAPDPVQEDAEEAEARCQAVVDRVAVNVRRLRKAKGWNQEEAASRCRIHATLFRTVEGGRTNLTVATAAHLAWGLEVDVAELFVPAPPLVRRKRGRPRRESDDGGTGTPTVE